jgi:2,3-dihydro-2,3-dihydroxybenzoate dehydrogenase
MPDLTGQVTLITGAAGGIGSAIARAFVAEGSSVILVDTNLNKLATLADDIKFNYEAANVLTFQADVTKGADSTSTIS